MPRRGLVLKSLGGLLAVLAGIQFVPVTRTNPAIQHDLQAPPEVKSILKTSCYDCHSNETRWPWYSRVAPVSWLVASDVQEARERMNFSLWNTLSPAQQAQVAKELLGEAKEGDMPPWYYTLIHGDAKLTPDKLSTLEAWGAKHPGQ